MNPKLRDTRQWIASGIALTFCFWLSLTLVACGGSGGQSTPPPPPSFIVAVPPTAPSIAPGPTSTFQVSITPQNGFNNPVAITVSGLPNGLSANPSSFSVQSTPQTVTLTATDSLADGNYSFAVSGASGSLSNSQTVSLLVGALQDFLIIQPLISQVVTRFGSTTQAQLQTELQGSGVIGNYDLTFSAQGLPTGV